MSRNINRALRGPSWTEVILGAFLSALLGVVLGAALLILRPVVTAKEEPKERARNTVYYIEGRRNPGMAQQALAKKKSFVEGQSVSVTEEEVNALITAGTAKPGNAAKQGEAAKDGGASVLGGYVSAGTPLVRIRESALQVGVPLTIDLLGRNVILQASGGFVKQGDVFVYEPETLYLGSCPLNRVPSLARMVREKILAAQPIPDDIRVAWTKLAAVSVEGNELKLAMP